MPVVIIFTIFSCLIHRNQLIHSMNRVDSKVHDLQKFFSDNDTLSTSNTIQRSNIVTQIV